MTTTDRLIYLLERIRASQASAEEYEELIGFIDSDNAGDIVSSVNAFHETDSITPIPYDVLYWRTALQEVLRAGKSIEGSFNEGEETAVVAPVHQVHFLKRYRWWAAASIIILLGVGAYFFFDQKPANQLTVTPAKEMKNDVPPGGNKAVLTLADGSNITLDSAANGQLTKQGKTTVIKSGEGKLVYDAKSLTIDHLPAGRQGSPLTYNTLTTPRGGQYQLVLPDGSKVWLDAASSITFPTAFDGRERVVNMTGQAYFKVTHNARQPFKVMVNGQMIEDLGTEFNINAYNDEAFTRTTLLEGSVRVHRGGQQAQLLPGQQAIINTRAAEAPIKVSPANTEQATAWLNGKFQFNNDDLQTIMRSLSRWYDVKVVFKDGVPDKHYLGRISRNVPISQVFQILKTSGINFTIDGNQIIVTN